MKIFYSEEINKVKKIKQFIRFAIVGCSNTIISLVTYYVLIYFDIHYIVAYTAGFLLSVCNAFFWNNRYVFQNKEENSILRAFYKVFLSYGLSYVFSLLLMSVLVEVLHIQEYVAPILKMCITIPLNFLLNKLWAFRDKT